MLVRPILYAAAGVAFLLTASAARGAAPPKPRPSEAPHGQPARASGDGDVRAGGIALRADGWDDGDRSGLRVALAKTLGVAITEPMTDKREALATVVVRRRADGNVTIVFIRPDGREVERTLDLPADRDLATETIALAAGNLVRDEAAELVASLSPTPPPPTEAPAASEEVPTVDAASAPPAPAKPRVSCTDAEPLFFGADFAPYAGSSSKYPDHRRTLSFNFVAGYARGLRGFELGVGANIESAFMCGVQIAAGANVVLGDARGVQLASANVALGAVQGVQVGVVNLAKGDIEGVQLSPVSIGGGALTGAQVGVVNLLGGSVLGNQSGVVNIASADVRGAQLGVVNIAHGGVDGVQIGTTNVATGEVRGTQVGVFNYAEVSDYPVGVLSVVRRGRTSVDGWVTESGIGMAGVRHGGRVIHNVYGVGYRAGSPSGWSFALGLGARLELSPKAHIDFETIAYWVQQSEPFVRDAQIASAGASFGYAITPVFGVFAAPTFNVLVTPDKELSAVGPFWGSTLLYESDTVTVRAWPGATLGIRAAL